MSAPIPVSQAPRAVRNGVFRNAPRRSECPCQDSWRILLAGIVALLLIFVLVGCGGGKKKDQGASSAASGELNSYNLMITAKTGLNKLGPDQTTPPESYLSAGTRIRMIQNAGTSYEIETINGERGFVSSNDVGPLMQ